MPSDDYASAGGGGGGALKLKGAKVTKHKKKKKDKEKSSSALEKALSTPGDDGDQPKSSAEREPDDQEDEPESRKTEAERRFEEARKKRLLGMAGSAAGLRPELLKSHKERVEELNSYLSKLSEHHDMPKIGPG